VNLPRPGCMVRSALIVFAMLFLPMAVLFLYRDWRRYWFESLMLIFVAVVFLVAGFNRSDDSWLSAIDDLGPGDRRK
jgi:hypothetical protein